MSKYYADKSGVYTLFHLTQKINREIKKSVLDGSVDLGLGTFMDDVNGYQKVGEYGLA